MAAVSTSPTRWLFSSTSLLAASPSPSAGAPAALLASTLAGLDAACFFAGLLASAALGFGAAFTLGFFLGLARLAV